MFRTTQILLERRKGKIAQPDQQTTCHHVKEDAHYLGGGDTFAICLAALEVSLLSTAAAPHLCSWMSHRKCFMALLSTIKAPVSFSSA